MPIELHDAISLCARFLKSFYAWWIKEVMGLCPPTIRTWIRVRRSPAIAEFTQKAVTLRRVVDGAVLAHIEEGDSPDCLKPRSGIILALPPSAVLVKRLDLPAAASRNLFEIVSFEIEKHTPFQKERAYFSYHAARNPIKPGRLNVLVAVASRKSIDTLVTLVERGGFYVQRVEFSPSDDRSVSFEFSPFGVAFLPKRRRLVRGALAGLALILLGTIPIQRIDQQQRAIDILTAETQRLKPYAQSAQKLQQKATQLKEQLEFIPAKKREQPVIAILDELARLLPDDTWVFDLEIRDNSARMQGYSAAASALIEIVDGSPLLGNAHFLSPLTQENKSGLERFAMRLDIKRDGAP